MQSSYPYLHLARKYGVPYRATLNASSLFDLRVLEDIQRFLRSLPSGAQAEVQAMPDACQEQILSLSHLSASERHRVDLDEDLYREYEGHLQPRS